MKDEVSFDTVGDLKKILDNYSDDTKVKICSGDVNYLDPPCAWRNTWDFPEGIHTPPDELVLQSDC